MRIGCVDGSVRAFTSEDRSTKHESTVEDLLPLLPGQAFTTPAFHQIIWSSISLSRTNDTAIVLTDFLEQCMTNSTPEVSETLA